MLHRNVHAASRLCADMSAVAAWPENRGLTSAMTSELRSLGALACAVVAQ